MSNEIRDKLVERENSLKDQMSTIVKGAATAERELTETENNTLAEYRDKVKAIADQISLVDETAHREDQHAKRVAEVVASVPQAEHEQHRTGGEEHVYHSANARLHPRDGGRSFLTDIVVARSQVGTPAAEAAKERLVKHQLQMEDRGLVFSPGDTPPEKRDIGTANLDGLVPPQYIFADAAQAVRSMRPTADAMNKRPMPQTGMTLHIPLITQASASTAGVVAENASSTDSNPNASDLEIPVKTVRGHVDVSVAAIHRGVMVDDLLMLDLQDAVETEINAQVIGEHNTAAANVQGLLIETSGSEVILPAS